MNNNLPPIGTKVFHHVYKWGEIIEINNDIVIALFMDGTLEDTFIPDELSLTPYTVEGFTPLSDYDKPKKNDWGYFWHTRKETDVFYSKLTDIKDGIYFDNDGIDWKNFSKEIPEHIKKLQNQ